jgi:hypothetical protein
VSAFSVQSTASLELFRRFRIGEARPIACLVHAAVARRCAEQEVDPRFSRLAALTLVNRMAASQPGMENGALELGEMLLHLIWVLEGT